MAFIIKSRPSGRSAEARNAQLIRASEFFDAEWYQAQNPDVRNAKADPALHYIRHGAREGRNPGPDFDAAAYLRAYPDVAASGLNPLIHYLLHGRAEGRRVASPDLHFGPDDGSLALPGLFPGSQFEELSLRDPSEIWAAIARLATPADILPRVSETLYSPTISIILPVYNTPPRYFREVLQSVYAQTYTRWELCIVDDGSSSQSAIAIFDELARSPDPRIKTRRLTENQGIARASHAALELASGEYVGFLDHDDLLTANALSEVVGCLRSDTAADFIYTDHVMINYEGTPTHYSAKPGWSPEFLLSTNYIVHFKVVRREVLMSIGGLSNETDNVQDLGVTCALAAAGARVRHVPKPVYLWREHRTSVALSTQAKPGIEDALIRVYDRHLAEQGIPAKQTWPAAFKAMRVGVFQLEFLGRSPSVALIVLNRGSTEDESVIRARFAPVLPAHVALHIVCLGPLEPGRVGISIKDDGSLLEFVNSLEAEVIVFANATTMFLGVDWLSRLSRYTAMDNMIGVAGGKTLDQWLQIRSGGMLLNEDGEYRTIGGGNFDSANGHWFNGQIASNVDAISSQLIATRRETFIEMGGIRFHTFGDLAGVTYSAALRSKGYRVVYDPFSRACDVGKVTASDEAWRAVHAAGRDGASFRMYEQLGA